MKDLLIVTSKGLYCPAGDFYIDADIGVPLNLITHGHSDHARYGSQHYISTDPSRDILFRRLGKDISLQTIPYRTPFKLGQAWVSFHPAGHILGSAQIRVEVKGKVIVASGDYKRAEDQSCDPFEVVECDTFISESTFGLPIYKWKSSAAIAQEIFEWWQNNAQNQLASILFCYSLGKAQRILSMLAPFAKEPILLHGATVPFIPIYHSQSITLAPTLAVSEVEDKSLFRKALILAPSSAYKTPWMKKFFPYRTGCASGWMAVRGAKRWANYDRGFVVSDHADWSALLQTIQETGAKKILLTHGFVDPLCQYLNENLNVHAEPLGFSIGSTREDEE